MNAISTLTVLPKTKGEIRNYVEQVKESILDGYTNPLVSAQMLKSLEDIIKALRDDKEIKEYILSEADKYGEKSFDFEGCKFTKRETPRYDFKNCNDSTLKMLEMQENDIKGKVKARKDMLKKLEEPTPDAETGEVINPPTVNKTSVLSVTLSK